MSDFKDPIQSNLWNRVQEIKENVSKGREKSPEARAVAWRVAESQGEDSVVDKIRRDCSSPTARFELSEKFLSEAKETEDELRMDGIELNPVPESTSQYMLEGLLQGVVELKDNKNPEKLSERLSSILSIASRAVEGIGFGNYASEDGNLGATYLNQRQIKELCVQVNYTLLFGSVAAMNEGVKDGVGVYVQQKASLEALNSVSERIVL